MDYRQEFFIKYDAIKTLRQNKALDRATEQAYLDWFIHNYNNIVVALKQPVKKEYRYMITFTIDPKKHPNSNEQKFQDEVQEYIEKLLIKNSNTCSIVKEHSTTNVHWHASVVRDKYIDQKIVQYYKIKYGHVDISKSFMSSEEFAHKYMQKEQQIKHLK